MSRSLHRVVAALRAAGLDADPMEHGECRTAANAAASVGCALDRIAKSIVFARAGGCAIFLTAGSRQVGRERAASLAGTALFRTDAATMRSVTGFAIGGVPPVGHLTPSPARTDRRGMDFDIVWAAAGTPRRVFPVAPSALLRIAGATLADVA